jgi:hypothetical protein
MGAIKNRYETRPASFGTNKSSGVLYFICSNCDNRNILQVGEGAIIIIIQRYCDNCLADTKYVESNC